VDTGVDADRVAFVRTNLASAGLQAPELRVALDELIAGVSTIPGVTAAAATSRLPASFAGTTTTIVEGYTPPAGTEAVELDFAAVTDAYFETLGIPVVAGRTFGVQEVADGAPVIVINEAAARRFWGTTDVIGRRTRGQSSQTWRTVIGVVGDAPVATLSEPTRPIMYFSSRQVAIGAPFIVARTAGAPETLIDPMRREISALRSSLTVSEQGTLAARFGDSLATPRFVATLMGAFSLLAVILAGIGIYAMVSFSVARRAPELGIRMALGAERSKVVRMVVGEVVVTVVIGLAAGIGVAALAAPRIGDALFGVRPLDPVTFAVAVAFMLAVSWLAAYLPARRAAKADPLTALRAT
jgi:predicted permease